MEENPLKKNKIWFRKKTFGFGWTPCSWEGWLVLLVWLASFILIVKNTEPGSLNSFIYIILMVGLLLLVSYLKGERLSWHRDEVVGGTPEDKKTENK